MFLFLDTQPEIFVDEQTGAQLTVSNFCENGKTKEITVEITDKEGRKSRVTLASKKDIRRFLRYFDAGIPIRPLECGTSSTSPSTAPAYIKTERGVYLVYKDSERSWFPPEHKIKSVLDRDYQSLCDSLGAHPDAIALFYWFDGSIGRSAIMRVIKFCLDYQKEFILTGDPMKCRPMSLKTVAQQTNVNIASVSRCADKDVRIYTPHTTFTLENRKYNLDEPSLFDEGIKRNSENVSRLEVMTVIHEMILKEDKKTPYSDDTIAEILKRMGYQIQRRTVSKYRENLMDIPSSAHRKR